jgi:hypothetical protein
MQRRELLKTIAGGAALGAVARCDAEDKVTPSDQAPILEQDGVKYWSESSLKRVYPNSAPRGNDPLQLSTARNARLSFQLCFRNLKRAAVEAPADWKVQVRRVGFVPMRHLDTDVPLDETEGVGHVPGLVPDPLYPEETCLVGPESNGVFWVTIRVPSDAKVGPLTLNATLTVEDECRITGWKGAPSDPAKLSIEVQVGKLTLQKRKEFPATHWISIDSIWEYYKIEPFSERFWELAEAVIANMVDHNVNVIYSPVFNSRHELLERPAQLLRVRALGDDKYEMDFTDVRRWIRLAKKHGADYVEWTHFFTPAPTSGRHPQRIYERWDGFGKLLWPADTLATSDVYRKFLEQFIPQFKQVLEEEGAFEQSLFHCADEPDGDVQLEDYRKARTMLRELAPWMKVIDAMSDPRYATEGLTDMPVPSIATAPHFAEAKCPAWVYFCCGPRGRYLQRFLDTPLTKLRMAGWLFYKLKARGFLHWGHNYWFVFCTGTPIDPFDDAATGSWPFMPYGDAFVIYPGEDGPLDSIRWEVFAESLQDFAMLQTAGIDADDALLAELKSYEVFPKDQQWITAALEKVLAKS